MRTLLCILLLSPAVSFASAYKCVVDGKTLYSQLPCGKTAQQVPEQIVVMPAQKVPESKSAAHASADDTQFAEWIGFSMASVIPSFLFAWMVRARRLKKGKRTAA